MTMRRNVRKPTRPVSTRAARLAARICNRVASIASRAARAAVLPSSLLYRIHSLDILVRVTPVGPAVLLKRVMASSCRPSSARVRTCLASTTYCRSNSWTWLRSWRSRSSLMRESPYCWSNVARARSFSSKVARAAARSLWSAASRMLRTLTRSSAKPAEMLAERRNAPELRFGDESGAVLDLRQSNPGKDTKDQQRHQRDRHQSDQTFADGHGVSIPRVWDTFD